MSVFAKYSRVILSVLLLLSLLCFFMPFTVNQPEGQIETSVTGFELLSDADKVSIDGEIISSGDKGVSFESEGGMERSYVHYHALILLTLTIALGGVWTDRTGKKKYAAALFMCLIGAMLSVLLMIHLSSAFMVNTGEASIATASAVGTGLYALLILQSLTLICAMLGLLAHPKHATAPAGKPVKSIAWISRVAVLGAVSAVLYYFEVPIIPPIYKLDLSAVPALIAGFAMGPGASLGVMAVKDLIGLTHTSSMGVGELADFLMSGSMTVVASVIYTKRHTLKGAVLSLLTGTVAMGLVGALANYFIMIPFYVQVMNMPMEVIISLIANTVPAVDSLWKMILLAVVPFNLLKGAVLSVMTLLLYKRIAPMLKNL